MPVIICGTPFVPKKKPISGRPRYNEAIKKLAPPILEARKNGHYGVQEIGDYLNDKGITAPNGRRLSYTTLHRILERLKVLRATEGPRSVSEGASARRYRPRRPRISGARVFADLLRAHPDLLKGSRMPGSKPAE